MNTIETRYATILKEVNDACLCHQRDPNDVSLLAVSKGHPYSAIKQLYTLGQRQFGESYINEALDKQNELSDLDIEWHYIGSIQSNKTTLIAKNFSWVHSIDRLKIAQRLSDQRDSHLPPLNICLQVNLNLEQSKSGANPSDALELANKISQLPQLRLRGLMALPQRETNFSAQRENFSRLRQLQNEIIANGVELDCLSMGMSNDFSAAIAEHSTHLRIGSALFGQRPS